ncbi:cytochrome c oxidase assembly factor [Babesia ovis]|uniref:Cytochrome c oxidase assembly factor n=1 Tax=Babesia ovis TaxID=5869 RepID=A0A9W5WVV1_BABOV|nr:cytochrome c oxidase assembly factor [Babesia ovis]
MVMANLLLDHREEIVAAIENHTLVAISGCYDSYAASYIPFFLYKAGFTSSSSCNKSPPRIAVAQSQTNDVLSTANSCSLLVGDPSKVSYHVESIKPVNSTSDILYLTEDCLLKCVLADPLLSDYGVIVLTNLEERLLTTEVILALLKRITSKRSRLRVVLCFDGGHVDEILAFFRYSSKDSTQFEAEGNDAPKPQLGNLRPLGKTCHVNLRPQEKLYDVLYLSAPCANYLNASVSTVWNICKNEPLGNILVFVPSNVEVEMLQTNLMESAKLFRDQGTSSLSIVPLYANETIDNHRKNHHHAARTIYICCDFKDYRSKLDTITYVVDCGFSRRNIADYVHTGFVECNVHATRDEMRQRSNIIRGKGKCFRLLTESDFNDNTLVMEYPISEIKSNDLTSTILFIKSLGVNVFSQFEFVVQPPIAAIEHALTILFLLGAIDNSGEVVYPCGNVMAELPFTPMLSNFLYRSTELGCSEEALTICAMLDMQDMVLKRGNTNSLHQTERLQAAMLGFAAMEGDLLSYFNVYQLARYYRDEDSKWLGRHMVNASAIRAAEKKRAHLAAILKKHQLPQESCGDNVAVLMETIFKSFFLNVACKEHLVKTIITSRQLDVELSVKTRVVDDEGNAILTNELQPYLMVSSLDATKSRRLYIHPASFLANEQPDWVVFNESLDINGELYMRDVTAIQPETYTYKGLRLTSCIYCASSKNNVLTTFFLYRFTSGRNLPPTSQIFKQPERHEESEDKFMYLQSRFAQEPSAQPLKEADSIGTTLFGLFIALFGITFACVPLYEFFCQQSGYMGTTKKVKTYKMPPEKRGERIFEIDFVTHSHLKWDFKPAQRNVVIGAGETTLAFYTAKNLTDEPVIGVAAYHVIPDEAGGYFNKIQCFCFEEQMLHPGEEVDLPVLFFLDPDILKDKRLFDVDKITLTYTFFEANSEIPPEYTTLLSRHQQNDSYEVKIGD